MLRLPLPSCSHANRVAVAFTGEGALFGGGRHSTVAIRACLDRVVCACRPSRCTLQCTLLCHAAPRALYALVRASDAVRLRCYRAQMKSVRIRDSKFGPALVIETTTRSGGYARTLAKTYVAPIRRQAEPVRPELAATFCGRAAPF